jgi:hypothetical protein
LTGIARPPLPQRLGAKPLRPLPQTLIDEEARNPWPIVADHARSRLGEAVPALAKRVSEFSDSVFGLTSGFFYLPAAQARDWGVTDDSVLTEFQAILAVGHFHFAFHDLVVDECEAPPVMCLLADACLLSYLDGLGSLVPARADAYRALHDRYYNDYAAALARDLHHREYLAPYQPDDLLGLGDKAAPGATALHVVADLAGCPERAETATRALIRLCTGLQLLDDLNDSARDAQVGNHTWPVTSALLAYPELDVQDKAAVEAAVVGSGAARGCLRLARHAFHDARRQAEEVRAFVLAELSDVWGDRCQTRQARLDSVSRPTE